MINIKKKSISRKKLFKKTMAGGLSIITLQFLN